MNKENNRSAAGLRRSAVVARIRLREEWATLKEIDSQPVRSNTFQNKKPNKVKATKPVAEEVRSPSCLPSGRRNRQSSPRPPSEALRGVVALVEVGSEARALPLRAALAALGASVVPLWSPLITHLVWAQGGCLRTRARARALACSLVSPLWVSASAAGGARAAERRFPAAPRASDLPSPAALRRALKKAEAENTFFNFDISDDKEKVPRLRISSENEHDTSADTSRDTSKDTSRDTTKDTSRDTTKDTSKNTSKDSSIDATQDVTKETTTDIESRVNTALRRALPKMSESLSPSPRKSKRKLFTQKEAEVQGSSDDEEENTRPNIPKPTTNKQTRPTATKKTEKTKKTVREKTEVGRRELARAERAAKRLVQACSAPPACRQIKPRIVLSGMCASERREMAAVVARLGGRARRRVDRRTTHVVLHLARPADARHGDARHGDTRLGDAQSGDARHGNARLEDARITPCDGVTNISQEALSRAPPGSAPRTLSALAGAARGARVLHSTWLRESAARGSWAPCRAHHVPHLQKIAQKARVERAALRKTRSEYAYDVFCGMRVFVTASAEQRDAAIELLSLCGAVVNKDGQNGGLTQNGRQMQPGQGLTQLETLLGNTRIQPTQSHALVTQNGEIRYALVQNKSEWDIRIGVESNEVSSKWVFDSVAAGRMRSTRRYVVKECPSQVVEDMQRFCIDDC